MQGHLQGLVNQVFMTTVELMIYRVPKDPASPAPVEGDVVSFAVFYEQWFAWSCTI
jgi:hypothetical protein